MKVVGKDSRWKRLKTEDGMYGYCDISKRGRYEVNLDVGGKVIELDNEKLLREAIERCATLNKRSWYVLEPENSIVAGRPDAITPKGTYPVYAARQCISKKYDEILRQEIAWLQQKYSWDIYHDSEGKGQFASGENRRHTNHTSRTNVKTLYGMAHCDAASLPVQNPCGLPRDLEWSKNHLSDPFVPMPPATRCYRDLVSLGNPSVTKAFQNVVGMKPYYLGCAAYTDYSHNTDVGGALAWHFDKALGVETMCISVTPPDSKQGSKTIGLGGFPPRDGGVSEKRVHINAAETFETMKIPPRSVWSCNAKAIYHAVGNDTPKSYTIVLRTQIPKSLYKGHFVLDGARVLTLILRDIRVRYLPVMTDRDVAETRNALRSWIVKFSGDGNEEDEKMD